MYCMTLTAVCTPACMNSGTCTSPGVCTCTSDWSGIRCGDRELMNIYDTFMRVLCYITLTKHLQLL